MTRPKILASGALGLTLAAALLAATPVCGDEAQPAAAKAASFNKRASGVYLVTGLPPEGPPFLLLFNIHRDRMFSASSQVQGTALFGFAFTDDQGIWKKTGRRQMTARLLSFNYVPPGTEPPAGALHSNGIADIVIDFSNSYSTVSGTFSVTLFAFDANPLAPDSVPLGPPLEILFEGERLKIP